MSSEEPPWVAWPLGSRVTIRRRLPDGYFSDVVGILESRNEKELTISSRRWGVVTIHRDEIAVGKLIDLPKDR